MRLVTDWRNALRWFSVQCFIVIGMLPVVWVSLPPDIKAMLPSTWAPWVFVALAVAGVVGRLVDQKK